MNRTQRLRGSGRLYDGKKLVAKDMEYDIRIKQDIIRAPRFGNPNDQILGLKEFEGEIVLFESKKKPLMSGQVLTLVLEDKTRIDIRIKIQKSGTPLYSIERVSSEED